MIDRRWQVVPTWRRIIGIYQLSGDLDGAVGEDGFHRYD
jgi:hypothetical protein